MPRVEEFQIYPLGWENDPEEERYKLSTLDYLSTTTFTNTALFFKVEEAEKPKVAALIREGLERSLAQVRHLVGRIERDEDGHHSIVKRRTSTVRFVIQHLDTPEDNYPSFDEIAKADFLSPILGDIDVLSVLPMTCGNKPEAHPDNHPPMSSFKLNFIPGGLIFNMHDHHYSNGLTGFNGFVKQVAENCYAILNKTEPAAAKEPEVEAPPRAHRNMQHKHSQSLMFHLPKSKYAELKKAATPSDGTRISTYNAVVALMWRVLSRIREPLYKPGMDYKPLWAEGVSISKLFTNPPMPERMQGNLQIDINSADSKLPEFTLAEVISEVPLSKLASYIRKMTDSVTHEMLARHIAKFDRIRNKEDLSIHVDSFPPMSILVSDWRYANYCDYDFGFANPTAFRHLFGGVPLSQAVVYPPHRGPAGDDEGMEVQVTFETEVVQQLLEDPEWTKYFEFRGVDAWQESDPKAKL